MHRYVETICIERGHPLRLDYHRARLRATLAHEQSPHSEFDLSACLSLLPADLRYLDRVRCRVVYDASSIADVTFSPYTLRPISRLRCIEADHAAYPRKSADRSVLNALFALRSTADDVIIVRNGLLTDTTIANLALFDGRAWHTPSLPLLDGTHRAALLAGGVLVESDIPANGLSRFSRLRLFNAMIRWGEIDLPTDCIRFHSSTSLVDQTTSELKKTPS